MAHDGTLAKGATFCGPQRTISGDEEKPPLMEVSLFPALEVLLYFFP